MTKLYSYIIPTDDGAAPNPFGGTCTLTICKPKIRKKAQPGDWIIGTGSKNTKLRDGFKYDFSKSLVYAMKVTWVKSLPDYDKYCNDPKNKLKIKIPDYNSKEFDKKVGDCIYDYSKGNRPVQRDGQHNEDNMETDLGGLNALLSTHFYYFGSEPKPIPKKLCDLIHITEGHLIFNDENKDEQKLIIRFEKWITQYKKNKLYSEPQMKYKFEDETGDEYRKLCSHKRLMNDKKDRACKK